MGPAPDNDAPVTPDTPASRAWQLAPQGVTLPAGATVSDVMTALSVDVPCSADAEIAIRGLLREEHELGPASNAVPEFSGPDAWYAAERSVAGAGIEEDGQGPASPASR